MRLYLGIGETTVQKFRVSQTVPLSFAIIQMMRRIFLLRILISHERNCYHLKSQRHINCVMML